MSLLNARGEAFIRMREGCRLEAYLDTAGIPTIGWGTIRYDDGRRVAMGDTITQAQADALFHTQLADYVRRTDDLTRDDLTDNQFAALVSFCYNVGKHALEISTLRKLVNANPADLNIREAFLSWCKDRGPDGKLRTNKGLLKRRSLEADLYWSP